LYQNDKVKLVERIRQLKKAGFSLREVKEMEEINGIVEENIFEKVDDNELNKMIKFLQSQLIKTEERLNETIKVKKGLEEIIEFLKKRKRT
jgi:DNA-binding transcriptional MerR regulator